MDDGEDEVAFFSAKRWDRRNRADLIESATRCHNIQVVGSYRVRNPLLLTVLAASSTDYSMAPRHLQLCQIAAVAQFLGLVNFVGIAFLRILLYNLPVKNNRRFNFYIRQFKAWKNIHIQYFTPYKCAVVLLLYVVKFFPPPECLDFL